MSVGRWAGEVAARAAGHPGETLLARIFAIAIAIAALLCCALASPLQSPRGGASGAGRALLAAAQVRFDTGAVGKAQVSMGGETPWHHEQLALSSPWLCHACVAVVCAFFGVVWAHIAKRPSMFTKRYARRHRLVALALLLWLMVGFAEVALGPWTMLPLTLYHAVLGVLGTATAVTAAYVRCGFLARATRLSVDALRVLRRATSTHVGGLAGMTSRKHTRVL